MRMKKLKIRSAVGKIAITLLLSLSFLTASATAQFTEKINDNGVKKNLCTQLLELDTVSFPQIKLRMPPGWSYTSLYRNYVGYWKIKNDSLFLDSIVTPNTNGNGMDFIPVKIEDIYAAKRTPSGYFADWVSDTLRITSGEIVQYQHMGWGSIWENEESMIVRNGKVMERGRSLTLVHPGLKDSELQEMWTKIDLEIGKLPNRCIVQVTYSDYDSDGNPIDCEVKTVRGTGDVKANALVAAKVKKWVLKMRPFPIFYRDGRFSSTTWHMRFPLNYKKLQ